MPPVFVVDEPVPAGADPDGENAALDIDQYDGVPRTRYVSQHRIIPLVNLCGLTHVHPQRYQCSHSTAPTGRRAR